MCLSNLSGCELSSLASIIAISLANNLSNDDINILANLLNTIGDNLALIASSSSNQNENC